MNLAQSPNAAALLTALLAAVLTAVIVPLVRRAGLHWGVVDAPDARKHHQRPIVRLGGVGIVAGFSLALALTWAWGGFAGLAPDKDQLIWTTLAGSLCFFVIGLADDLYALPPLPRLVGQVAVAMAVWSQGVRIGSIDLPSTFLSTGAVVTLPPWISLVATVFWLVGITNAINWLDGLDGLAAGVSGIAAVALLSVSYSLHQSAPGLLGAALAGACLGFLRHNFNPAKIFMGDGGSYFLGFALASISTRERWQAARTAVITRSRLSPTTSWRKCGTPRAASRSASQRALLLRMLPSNNSVPMHSSSAPCRGSGAGVDIKSLGPGCGE